MLKHFEMLSRVLQLYCNIVAHNQAEVKGDDWTENKYFTEPPYYTHIQQNKQVLIVAADTVLTQTLTPMIVNDVQTQTDRQTDGNKIEKNLKTNTVVNAGPPDTEYVYYILDVEGVTIKGLLLPASTR